MSGTEEWARLMLKPTILLVDDSPLVRLLAGGMLVREGCRVLEAGNGREGYEIARRERPDLIIMDLEMPEWDGIKAAVNLKRTPATRHIPIMFVTANQEARWQAAMQGVGAAAILHKPFKRHDLWMTVCRLLA